MIALYIILAVLFFIAINIFIGSYVGYKMSFYSDRQDKPHKITKKMMPDDFVPYYDFIFECRDKVLALPSEQISITSHDGLKLHAKYYEYAPGAVTEIMGRVRIL